MPMSRLKKGASTPGTRPAHTPDWTNFSESDPGITGKPLPQLRELALGGPDTSARRRAVLTKPDILILDEPTTPESKERNRWIEPLAWSWGASQSGKTPSGPLGIKTGQDKNAAANDGYVPSVEMVSGTSYQAPPPGGACYPEDGVCEPPEPEPNCTNC